MSEFGKVFVEREDGTFLCEDCAPCARGDSRLRDVETWQVGGEGWPAPCVCAGCALSIPVVLDATALDAELARRARAGVDDLGGLADLALAAAAGGKAQADALRAKREAEAKMLAAIVESVREALPFVASKISLAKGDASRFHLHDVDRGLFLGAQDDVAGPRREGGAFVGHDFFLLEDGTFLCLEYQGAEGAGWEALRHVLTPLGAVVRGLSVKRALGAIRRALEAQVSGNAGRRTEQISKEVERIKAALVFLERA